MKWPKFLQKSATLPSSNGWQSYLEFLSQNGYPRKRVLRILNEKQESLEADGELLLALLKAIENHDESFEKAILSRFQPSPVAADLHELYPTELATLSRSDLERTIQQRAQAVYLGHGVTLARILTRYKILLHTSDRGFACHVMMDGFWEMWLTRFFARIIKPGMRVLDVGANYGYYSLLFADMVTQSGHVVAVEPNPAAAALLRESLQLNGFSDHTTVMETALGATAEGSAQLIVPMGEPKNAYLSNIPNATARTVTVTSIDRIARGLDRIDLIKIDAEGSEADIIIGMRDLLHTSPPNLLLEFNAGRCADPAALISTLVDCYGEPNVIDFDSAIQPCPVEMLLSSKIGEDWLLFFPTPGT